MKKSVILCTIILLALLPMALVVGCQQQPESTQPTHTPTPPATQAPETTPADTPTPTPTQEPTRPILYFDLEEDELVIKAVHADGRQLGTLVQGVLAGWSPDGTWFAYLADDERLNIMNLQGEIRTIFTPAEGESIFLYGWQYIWAPDGSRIALLVNEIETEAFSLVIIDTEQLTVVSRYNLPDSVYKDMNWPPYKLSWSPDGSKVLLSWESTAVVDTATGIVEVIAGKTAASWAPSSDGVYYFDGVFALADFFLKQLGNAQPVKLFDKASLETIGIAQPWGLHAVVMSLSPSGSKLAIAGGSTEGGLGSLHLYDLKEGELLALDNTINSYQTDDLLIALEWSPDEDSLAILTGSSSTDFLSIKVLDLTTDTFTTLATAGPLQGTDIDVIGLVRTLSWTQ